MKSRNWLAPLMIFLAPFVFYLPITLAQKTFFAGDFFLWLYPIRATLAQAMTQWRIPLWDPTIAFGFPIFAEGQMGALRPIYQIIYRLLPTQVGLGYELLIHLGLMMLGMFYFARALKLSTPAAILAALILPASGYLTDYLLSLGVVYTFAHLPWMLWLLEKIFAESRRRKRIVYFILLCVAAFDLWVGHPYFMLIGFGVLMFYALCWQGTHSDPSAKNWQPFVIALIAIVIALGLAAAQILPTLEISRYSTRAGGFTYDDFTIYSIAPEYLALMIAPYSMGNPADIPGGIIGYIGIAPLILALLAPIIVRDRRTTFWLIVTLGGLALAMGKYNPIFPLLYQIPGVNSLRMAGNLLAVFTFGLTMLSALMFDWLMRRAPVVALPRRFPIAVVGLIALGLALIYLAYALPLQTWLVLWNYLPIVWSLLAALILILAWRRKIAQPGLAVAILAVSIFDLISFSAVYLQTRNTMVSLADFSRAPQALSVLSTQPGESRILTLGAMVPPFAPAQASLYPDLNSLVGLASVKGTTGLILRYPRNYTDNFSPGMLNLANARYLLAPQFPSMMNQPTDKFGLRAGMDKIDLPALPAASIDFETYLENSNLADGARVANIQFYFANGATINKPLRVGIETAYWLAQQTLPPIASTFPSASFAGHTYRARFDFANAQSNLVGFQFSADSRFDLLHIEHIRWRDAQGNSNLLDYTLGASNHSTIYRDDLVTVIENHDALPRAFLMHAAQIANDADTLKRLRDYTFDPKQMLWLAEGDALASDSPEQDDDESVRITQYAPERVQLSVTANRAAYLVLTDTWYPGWLARIDGKPAPIYRADYVFRAVPIEPGTHTVEFDFRSASFEQGATISLVTLALSVLGFGGWLIRQ